MLKYFDYMKTVTVPFNSNDDGVKVHNDMRTKSVPKINTPILDDPCNLNTVFKSS